MSSRSASTTRALVPAAAAIFATALVLGLVYNSASPLGIRSSPNVITNSVASTRTYLPEPVNAPPALTPSAMRPAHTRTGYYNQTLSVAFTALGETTGIGAKPSTNLAKDGKAQPPEVTWPEVKAMLSDGKTILIDARMGANYQAEHIPGAVSLPSTTPSAGIAAFLARYSKQAPFVIYCGSTKCAMSHTLANVLINDHGCTNVKVMTGGYAEYRAALAKEGAK